jgi:hypothetical protein
VKHRLVKLGAVGKKYGESMSTTGSREAHELIEAVVDGSSARSVVKGTDQAPPVDTDDPSQLTEEQLEEQGKKMAKPKPITISVDSKGVDRYGVVKIGKSWVEVGDIEDSNDPDHDPDDEFITGVPMSKQQKAFFNKWGGVEFVLGVDGKITKAKPAR